MLRRQLRTHRTRTRARVSRQGIDLIVKLLRKAHIVGVNELHPGLHKWFDEQVAAQIPCAVCHGSTRGDAIFWRRPQWRGAVSAGGWVVGWVGPPPPYLHR